MSIKYELSLWRDYPGSTGIREEKMAILATTGMDFAGRAQNIKLKREYTGKITLEFEIPVKYMDLFSGEFIKNPLCSQVMEKSKLKLWRDELWYNPFGGTKTVDSKTGITKYTGAWEQGRWYDLVVDSHKEKRSKKQLFYSYTCNSLFISELSRNGYSLQFVPDTDIMGVNGMGTAHDLAERIVDGTGWEYIKTEVFPDYKEEFNAVTGETVKTPVSTDQVEFAKGLERYCYCYEVEISDSTEQTKILDSINEQLYEIEHPESNEVVNITRPTYGFINNKFWWKAPDDTNKKNYVLGHIKTDISINGADNIMCADSGEMKYYTDFTETVPTKLTGATDIGSIANLWTAVSESVSYERTPLNNEGKTYAYLRLTSNAEIVYEQGASKPLSQGKLYCVKIDCAKEGSRVQFSFSDGAVKTDENGKKLYAFTKELSAYNGSVNAYGNTYWFTVPKYINKPYFYIKNLTGAQMDIRAIYIYEFKGATKEIDKLILEKRSNLDTTSGLVHDLLKNDFPAGTDYIPTMRNVRQDSDNTFQPIWLGFGKTTAEGYKKETNTYLMDFGSGGKYYQVYLPVNNNKKAKLTKISSYETDKRRSIKGEKSNRFTLIETVSKTFNCFTRFIIEHDSQGHIKLENGRPIKRFTFVSELGRKNFNGFNYGVNLESIERTIDANNLVTKCHVESLSNQFTDSNMVTIQQSKYNKLGMTYIYNFSYYLRRGLLDKDKFLKDYQQFTDDVHRLTQANLTKIEQDGGIVTRKSNLESDISTYELMLEAYKSTAAESLATIGWDRFINGEQGNFSGHKKTGSKYNFPDIDITTLTYYNADGPTGYTYYTETVPIFVTDKSSIPTGKYYIPNRYKNIDELAQYIAYNRIGSVRSDDYPGVPPSVPTTDSEFWGRGLSKDTIFNELNKVFSTQQNYNQTQAKLEQARTELEQVSKQVDEYNAILEANNKEIQRKVTSFERKYADYIIEGQWKGNDYIDADTYYLDATRAMSVSCMPKVSYTIGAVDLSQLSNPFNPEDTDWGKEFIYNVGDTTYVKDEELFGNTEQLTMIATITSYIDLDKQDDIEMRNYETRFEELFQQIAAGVTSVQFNENIWGKAAGFTADGGIDETILQAAFNNNKNLVIASANNTVTQDNKGITVKDNDTGRIVRLIGGGLFLSHDGGNTYKAGITPDGINASLITTGQLDTSKIVIRSTDTPNFELTDQGLTAYSSIVDSRITRFDQFGIYSTDKAHSFAKNWWTSTNNPEDYIETNSIFSLTRKGLNFKYTKNNLTLGTIGTNLYGLKITENGNTVIQIGSDAVAKIGKWRIKPDAIIRYVENEQGQETSIPNTIISGTGIQNNYYTWKNDQKMGKQDWRIWCGDGYSFTDDYYGKSVIRGYFGVTNQGHVYASKGIIGGWTLGDYHLYGYNSTHDVGSGFMMDGSAGQSAPAFYTGYTKSVNGTATTSANDFPVGETGWVNDSWNSIGSEEQYGPKDGSWFSYGSVTVEISQNGYVAFGDVKSQNGNYLVFQPRSDADNKGLTVKGNIIATSGEIGGWKAENGVLGSTQDNSRIYFASSQYSGSYWIRAYSIASGITYFSVNRYGALYARDADIEGKITATEGTFTGTIKAGSIILPNSTTGSCQFGDLYLATNGAGVTSLSNKTDNIKSSDLFFADPDDNATVTGLVRRNDTGTYSVGFTMTAYGTGQWHGSWSASSASSTWSDQNKKHEILTLSNQYSVLFDNLRPVTYKYNDGTSDRLHTGFIAQEVQKALDIAKIDSKDFAGLVILDRNTQNELWTLRYEEFIALNTSEIQKLKARVAELEAKVASLTSI